GRARRAPVVRVVRANGRGTRRHPRAHHAQLGGDPARPVHLLRVGRDVRGRVTATDYASAGCRGGEDWRGAEWVRPGPGRSTPRTAMAASIAKRRATAPRAPRETRRSAWLRLILSTS